MFIGFLDFGCFSALWTSLAFLLAGAPYDFGNAVIGLFGLLGAAGAAAASVSGRLSDKGHGRRTMTASLVLMAVSWALLALGRASVVALVVGIVVLDLGAQSAHIANQSTIYGLRAEARSRLTTAYMVAFFCGGAVLSALSALLYESSGWTAVCILGGVTGILALVGWMVSEQLAGRTRRRRREGRPLTEGASAD
jgi:MFS family permease